MHMQPNRRFTRVLISSLALALLWLTACGGDNSDEFDASEFDPLTDLPFTLEVSSSDFYDGGDIPARFTCDGENISPLLAWERPPDGTESVALIVDDPDAPSGIFTHWVVFNLPGDSDRLSRDIAAGESIDGGIQGTNDFEKAGYDGPCPPEGDEPHEYRFLVYGMNARLDLDSTATAEDVLSAIRGSVIATGELTGMYARR